MAKRKIYASIIILIVAAITLVSGTYAWFLVGGFGSLFDIGFNVIQASAGLELRGSAGSTTDGWKSTLERVDFTDGSFIDAENGAYAPISTATAIAPSEFVKVSLKDNEFTSSGVVNSGVDYNDFTLFVRSSTEETTDVYMGVKVSGDAGKAARVSVTYKGVTTIYALEGETATNAVTTAAFGGTILDVDDNRIISSADTGYTYAGLTPQPLTFLTTEGKVGSTGNGIPLEDVAINSNATGTQVDVRIWIEGNDPDCIDFGESTIAGKELKVEIDFITAA